MCVVLDSTGFRPRTTSYCLARPERRNYRLVRLEERNFCVEAKGPKTILAVAWPPASAGASSSGALRGSPTPAARKLAESVLSLLEGLKQGPPIHESVHSCGRMAGIG